MARTRASSSTVSNTRRSLLRVDAREHLDNSAHDDRRAGEAEGAGDEAGGAVDDPALFAAVDVVRSPRADAADAVAAVVVQLAPLRRGPRRVDRRNAEPA